MVAYPAVMNKAPASFWTVGVSNNSGIWRAHGSEDHLCDLCGIPAVLEGGGVGEGAGVTIPLINTWFFFFNLGLRTKYWRSFLLFRRWMNNGLCTIIKKRSTKNWGMKKRTKTFNGNTTSLPLNPPFSPAPRHIMTGVKSTLCVFTLRMEEDSFFDRCGDMCHILWHVNVDTVVVHPSEVRGLNSGPCEGRNMLLYQHRNPCSCTLPAPCLR